MRRVILLVTAGVVLAGGVARADLDEGDYAPAIDAKEWMNTEGGRPVSLSELKGMVVVLYFFVSYDQAGEQAITFINQIANSPFVGRSNGVYVIGVTSADRQRVQDTIKEERIFFPIALESDAAEEYEIERFPRLVIVDPTGRIAYSDWPEGGQAFGERIGEVMRESPPFRTHPREAERVYEHLERARAAIREGDYREAIHHAEYAYDHALRGTSLKAKSAAMVDLIESLGRDELMEGRGLVEEGQHVKGVRMLEAVRSKFRGAAVARHAKRRLRKFQEHHPEVRRAAETIERESEAEVMLAEATKLLWERQFGPAHDKLNELIATYGETGRAADAKKVLQRIERNDKIMQAIRDYRARSDCESWLAQYRNFKGIRDYRNAKRYLRKIINEYPDTKYSERAYRELATIP